MQNIIVDKEEDAKEIIKFLEEKKAGKATFLPLSKFNNNNSNNSVEYENYKNGIISKLKDIRDVKKYVYFPKDIVKVNEKYLGIISVFLDKTLIVENIDIAISVTKKIKGIKVVTLNGELFASTGSITGGYSKKVSNILGRKEEIVKLEKEIVSLERKAEETNSDFEDKKAEYILKEKEHSNILNEIYEEKLKIVVKEKEINALREKVGEISEKIKNINNEIENITKESNEILTNKSIIEEVKGKLVEELEKMNDERLKLKENLNDEDTSSKIEEIAEDIMNVKISIASFEESENSIIEILERITSEEKELEERKEKRNTELLEYEKENTNLGQRIEENTSDINKIEEENVENKRAVHFGQKATNEEIKEGIKNIEKLIENYRKYVPNYTEEYGSRVLEIIFYCFTAPYIQQIRSCFKSTDSKEGISPFLFIGGTPFSGKTKLLNLIVYRMIGIEKKKRGEKETVSTYSSIVPKNSKWRANTIDQLDYWLREDNVYPIFVDELDKDFFANPERSDKLVTNLVNDTGFHGKSGCLIGTTNSNSFEMPKRSARRSYYIKIDKVFDEKRFSECNREYNKILNKTNNKLFKDFVVRMAEELSKENVKLDNYSQTSNSEKIDFLFLTRKIFREYFEIADIKIPKWFPQNRYNDISEQNMEKWKSCYQMLPEKFKVIEEDGKKIYGFNLRELNVDKNTKENVSYYEAMANQCIIVNSDQYLKFDIEKFHEWIGIPVPKELRKKKNIFNFFKKKQSSNT